MTDRARGRFGSLLRRHRQAAGLTQEELAERAGLSATGIASLETGRRSTPQPHTVRLLATALALDDAERAALIVAARPDLGLGADAPSDAPGGTPGDAPTATRLPAAGPAPPAPPTRLIGREREVADVCARLRRDDVRLVTLTGPGGIGKTRVAQAVAAATAEAFADGVVWVDLGPIAAHSDRTGDLVGGAIRRALGVLDADGRPPVATLSAALAARELLLVLDNLEHLLPAVPLVADLLAGCPTLTVLATSRVRLRLRGEREVPIEPLTVPDPRDEMQTPTTALAGVPAVRLFVERAADVRPGFALTDANAGVVAEICRRLDGLPLAIELAATRIKALPPDALLARLDQRLPLLTGGARDLPDRQRTLRDAIAWSYDLLGAEERTAFERLAVFAGGFTLEAAEAVMSTPSVLDLVTALADASLLRRIDDGDAGASSPRFGMLETVREYGLERLALGGDDAPTREGHARWALAFAEAHAVSHHDPDRDADLARLDAEWPNLQGAMAWFEAAGLFVEGLRLAVALFPYCTYRSRNREVGVWLERLLAAAANPPVELRSRVLSGLTLIRMNQGAEALAAARRHAADGLALLPMLAPRERYGALMAAGCVAMRARDDRAAEEHFDAALGVAAAFPDRIAAVTATADALSYLGEVALARGKPDLAAAPLGRALALYREGGDAWGEMFGFQQLGDLERERGAPAAALARYRQCLDAAWPARFWGVVAAALEGVACVAATWSRHATATGVAAAARTMRDRIGIVELMPADAAAVASALTACRAHLGDAAFAATWEAGRTLSEGELRRIVADLDSAPSASASAANPPRAPLIPIPPRVKRIGGSSAR